MPTVALRAALVWHDEVMGDIVVDRPQPITLGCSGQTTFTIPNVGLPQNFAIISPGNRGFLLTLGARMRGTICIDGNEFSVEEFVAKGGGGFHATPISGRDWGVIDLDETGTHKLFFQFVPFVEAESVMPTVTPAVIWGALGGWAIASIGLGSMFLFRNELDFAEALARGAAISLGPVILAAVIKYILGLDGSSQASFAFSTIIHLYLLFWTYKLFDPNDNPFVYPGPRSMTGQYLVTRLQDPPPEEKPPVSVGAAKKEDTAAPKSAEKPNNAATKGDEGAAGGKGEVERARDKNAKENVKREAPKVAFFEDKNKKYLDNIVHRDTTSGIEKFEGLKGDETKKGDLGFGPGQGTGAGDGSGTGTTKGSKNTGSGGNGYSDSDIVRGKGPIDTGKNRPGGNCVGANCAGAGPKEVKVAMNNPSGDFGGLTAEEIDRVVRARQGIFRACYQKELNHTPGLGGQLNIKFKIGGDGAVQSAATSGGSSLRNAAVESCVTGNIMRLKFPAKGGVANVNYPFVFSQGG